MRFRCSSGINLIVSDLSKCGEKQILVKIELNVEGGKFGRLLNFAAGSQCILARKFIKI